jgi:quercetin dioxygenase-like cupin family protein
MCSEKDYDFASGRNCLLRVKTMVIKQDSTVLGADVLTEGAADVTKQVLIGPDDGSVNVIMRCFTVAPGGHTKLETHALEHVVSVKQGRGMVVSAEGEHEITVGYSVFVAPFELHQFKNPFEEPFVFLCTIPNTEQK